jgi:acyl-CoA synthetase (NDP forming)
MEGFREGRRFFQAAREVVRRKPVIICKAGRTEAGARATHSHTASLAGEDRVFEALCRQTGILRADEVLQPFDMAEALAHQPLPKGRRVGIMGSGGQGVVTSDACSLIGLEVPEFDAEAQDQFRKELPPHAPTPHNPLDFAGGTRTAQEEAQMAERMARLSYIDGIITNVPVRGFLSGGPEEQLRDSMEACRILTSIPQRYGKPVILLHWLGVRRGAAGAVVDELIRGAGIPIYDTPEQCARAFLALARYREIRCGENK